MPGIETVGHQTHLERQAGGLNLRENDMKTLAALLIALSTLLTGCVVYDTPHRDGGYHGYRDGGYRGDRGDRDRDRDGIPNRVDRDRDNDGVPNWRDRRPDDPRRY